MSHISSGIPLAQGIGNTPSTSQTSTGDSAGSVSFQNVLNNAQSSASQPIPETGGYKKLDILEKSVIQAAQEGKISSDQKDKFLSVIEDLKAKFQKNHHAHCSHMHPHKPEVTDDPTDPNYIENEVQKTTKLESFLSSISVTGEISATEIQKMKEGLTTRKEYMNLLQEFKKATTSSTQSTDPAKNPILSKIIQMNKNAITPSAPNSTLDPNTDASSDDPNAPNGNTVSIGTGEDYSLNTSASQSLASESE